MRRTSKRYRACPKKYEENEGIGRTPLHSIFGTRNIAMNAEARIPTKTAGRARKKLNMLSKISMLRSGKIDFVA